MPGRQILSALVSTFLPLDAASGRWRVKNGPGNVQLTFQLLGGGFVTSAVHVIAPAKLLLDNMSVFMATYVPA